MKKNRKFLLMSKEDYWIRPFFFYHKKLLLMVILLGSLTFLCGSALMFTSGYLISKAATKPFNILLIYTPIVMTRAFGIARPVLRYLERLASHNWVLRMTSKLRLKLYETLEQNLFDTLSKTTTLQSGDILGLLAEDIEHIQNLFLRTFFPLLISWLLSSLIVIFLGLLSWKFALLSAIFFVLLTLLLPLVSILYNQTRIYDRKEAYHQLYVSLTDAIIGLGDWQYSGRKQDFFQLSVPDITKAADAEQKLNRFSRWRDFGLQCIFGLFISCVFLWSANLFAVDRMNALNWVAAFVLAFFPLVDAFLPVSQAVTEWTNYEDTARRLAALSDKAELPVVTDSKTLTQPKKAGSIAFCDITYRYTARPKNILENFNLSIAAGEKVALIGKSGAGKTTLLQLLTTELEVQTGKILLEKQDLGGLKPEITKWVGILDQKPYLFNTTLRNNVALGNLEADDQTILSAVEQVGLSKLLASLPAGLDTQVEENGQRFSGGEQQRIALARLLLQDVPIILLDEPTVGLDPITEKKLLDTIFQTLAEKTIIWVTHHLTGIEAADRIVFLEAGKIIMAGSSQQLLVSQPRYRQLYELDRF